MSVVTQDQVTRTYLPSTTSSSDASTSLASQIGKDQFLQLLVAQMQYQDPLNPMENTDFTAQLAQFSSLEQLYNLNSHFTDLKILMAAQTSFKAMDLIGKGVKAESQFISVAGGQITAGSFNLPEYAGQATVSIYDLNGTLIRTIYLSSLPAGSHEIDWDGADSEGQAVPDGNYYFEVSAENLSGEEIEATCYLEGEVTGMTFGSDGTPILYVNGLEIPLADVLEITKYIEAAAEE